MARLLFEKTGRAIWISHLDLMRLFQRAFKRAGLPLKHSQGFNPRPSVSIALPLSVGVESKCELLDFDLVDFDISFDEIKNRLNATLVEGVQVIDAYAQGRKIRDLSYLRCKIWFEYDDGLPENACKKLASLFSGKELIVPKKTKNGVQDQDIIPMLRSINIQQVNEKELVIDAVVCCQNPTLNPAQLAAAVEIYAPELKPDFSKCQRIEIFDKEEKIFR